MNEELGAPICPLYHRAIELIGRRWSGAILRALQNGENRFSDIAAVVPGLSDRLLSERLKELEAEGLVVRIVYPEMPVRIEYRLTDKGRALGEVMDAVASWAHEWLVEPEGEAKNRALAAPLAWSEGGATATVGSNRSG